MTGNSVFIQASHERWHSGFANLFRAEMKRWWKTRLWWIQSLIWILAINSLLLIIAQEEGGMTEELSLLYGVFGGLFTSIGVVIIMQGAVVGEKISGTAAWVLSKPVSPASFILAKWAANSIGVLVTAVLIPGVLTFLIFTQVAGISVQPFDFLAGLSLLFLFNLFWLSLTIMLGAYFNARGAVIGIPLALLLGQQFLLGMLAQLSTSLILYTPFPIIMPDILPSRLSLVATIIAGKTPETMTPVLVSVLGIVLFLWLGIWRFSREEF